MLKDQTITVYVNEGETKVALRYYSEIVPLITGDEAAEIVVQDVGGEPHRTTYGSFEAALTACATFILEAGGVTYTEREEG